MIKTRKKIEMEFFFRFKKHENVVTKALTQEALGTRFINSLNALFQIWLIYLRYIFF